MKQRVQGAFPLVPAILLVLAGCGERPLPTVADPVHSVTAADVCIEDITLSSQAEVDAFGCTVMTGELRIGAEPLGSDITDLSSLARLTSVRRLRVDGNPALASLEGLEGVTSVGGELSVRNNSALLSLRGLRNLRGRLVDLDVSHNAALTTLAGLDGVTSVGHQLHVVDNASLTSLAGLRGVSAAGYLRILDNPALTTLEGLETLETVGDFLRISGNASLASLQGMRGLRWVRGMIILDNPALRSLEGVENLATIHDDLSVVGNASLATLAGLQGLRSVRFVSIARNAALTSLEGLQGLVGAQDLVIRDNPALVSLQGLRTLTQVLFDLEISGNASLISLRGLDRLGAVYGTLRLANNPALTSLEGLGNLRIVGGEVTITDNASLLSLEGLGRLHTVYGPLRISRNAALRTLDGLEQLTELSGLEVTDNPVLRDCACGLAGLVAAGFFEPGAASVVIRDNAPTGSCTSPAAVLAARCEVGDRSPPTITILTPAEGAVFTLDQQIRASYRCEDEPGGSGLASCTGPVADGALLRPTSVGPQAFTVEAVDRAGNVATRTHAYRVVYPFRGFFGPVRPGVNRVNAGRTVPMRWSLGGDFGLGILAPGSPVSRPIHCSTGAVSGPEEPARTPGNSRLGYHAGSREYGINWKTERSWAGTCREYVLRLDDGSEHTARFAFR